MGTQSILRAAQRTWATKCGTHARFAIGAGSLPFNVAVEVAAVLEVA